MSIVYKLNKMTEVKEKLINSYMDQTLDRDSFIMKFNKVEYDQKTSRIEEIRTKEKKFVSELENYRHLF